MANEFDGSAILDCVTAKWHQLSRFDRQATRQHVVGESGVTSAHRLSSKRWVTQREARRSRSRRSRSGRRPKGGQ